MGIVKVRAILGKMLIYKNKEWELELFLFPAPASKKKPKS